MTVEEVTLAADRLRRGEAAFLPIPLPVRSLILLVELLDCKAEDLEVLPVDGPRHPLALEVRMAA